MTTIIEHEFSSFVSQPNVISRDRYTDINCVPVKVCLARVIAFYGNSHVSPFIFTVKDQFPCQNTTRKETIYCDVNNQIERGVFCMKCINENKM